MLNSGNNASSRPDSVASIDRAMRELRGFPRAQWLDLARSDQSHRWRHGAGVAAENYFELLPEFRANIEEALVLINGEVQLRRETGYGPDVEEYSHRFPEFAERIAVQFKVDRMLASAGAADAIDDDDEISVLELPGYEFLDEIGRGAAGIVYRARQESLSRFVAIKVVAISGTDSKQLARQRQEAEILARLNHPNIVHIHEVREYRGYLHLVMEYVDGRTLADSTRGRPSSPIESAAMIAILAEAIHIVHEAGVLHRDLKPSNVLLTKSSELKISDFGLAKLQSNANLLTTTDSVLGTPCYMAPEQAMGEAHWTGPEGDVYSLGAMLYEFLTGRPPLLGATVLDTLSLIRFQEPVAPRQLQPQLPRDLQTICLKCLAKLPKQRYATAHALAADLRRFLGGAPILARSPSTLERLVRFIKRKPAAGGLVASVILLAGVVATALWSNLEQRRRLSTVALVDSIATADSQSLSQLLAELSMQRGRPLPLIRAALAGSSSKDPKWVNLAIAELAIDPAAATADMLAYLPHARPHEVPPIVEVLAPHATALLPEVWQRLMDDKLADDARLNFGCLAAQIDAQDQRWSSITPAVAQALVQQHPLDIGTFTLALWPVRKALVPSLVAQSHNSQLAPIAREVTVGILARYAAEQPLTLVDLAVEAEASEFRLIMPPLQSQAREALPRLKSIANQAVNIKQLADGPITKTEHEIERAYDAAQRRRACAMVAMWQLGEMDIMLASLKFDADPDLRAWLIELAGPLGITTNTLWTRAKGATDSGMRQALLLSLGQCDLVRLSLAEREYLVSGALEFYRNDSDAGVHSACSWLLRNRLNASEEVDAVDKSSGKGLSPERNWFVGPNGHSLAVFRGSQMFVMGSSESELLRESDEIPHEQQIGHGFAVATEEVTIKQFQRFRKTYANRRYSPTDDCPNNNVTWFEAAAYCRWLSEQEGMPEDQMCYPTQAEIKPGMILPDHWVERTGYRLPTEAEWEFAARGGVSASRFCGEGEQLRSRYAWFLKNSDNHAWPVGQLKPNNFGLFDILGNVAERCQDAMATYPDNSEIALSGARSEQASKISATDMRVFRGGNFGDIDSNVRSARRGANTVSDAWALIGFRPARTISP